MSEPIIIYSLFVVGFVFLIKGADLLVNGASSIAKKFHISDFVIGLTIVSLGTSMPELLVNIIASLNESSEIALGNIVGSNISNIFLVLGVSALIYPLNIQNNIVKIEVPYSILAIALLGFLANANLYGTGTTNQLSQIDGVILLLFFAMFIIYIIKISKETNTPLIEEVQVQKQNMGLSILYIVLGCGGLFLGGKWVVEGAVHIATQLEMSESLVGLTIVAIGTSLPELVTSAVAAYKKNTDIAIANVLGSNIFNILWVLGVSALIHPLEYDTSLNTDITILIGGSILIMGSIAVGKKNLMTYREGLVFLFCYFAYITYLIYRG